MYADLSLAVHTLLTKHPQRVRRVLIVDLDAHQGNGHERDFFNDPNVVIFDA